MRIQDAEEIESALKRLGAVFEGETSFTDTYFDQPLGRVLKITENKEGTFLVSLHAKDGKFRITKKEAIEDSEKIKNELSAKYGIRRILKGRRQYFNLADFKISLNSIDGLGNFLILTGNNPNKEFIEDTLGIKDPEYITVSFDNL